ncbi:chromophore lyase CpcT/CpeT [Coleofasciculus sp. FACHB-1120]|uniref:CpcT/CpeT family chromophore lyase n=1 Tax=Coleofasciculus sp. FACHB-1120 TaxID=2692783 RepID=UPI0018EF5B6B
MKNTRTRSLIAIALVSSTGTAAYSCPANNLQASLPIQQQVGEVVSHLVGVMDTSAQAQAKPKAPNVRMTTCKVSVADTKKNPQTVFLYQEQAMSENLAKPYRQRFLKIAPTTDNQSIESQSFKPPTPEAFIGLCSQPEAKRVVRLSDVGSAKCSVFLKRDGDHYIGETPEAGCPSDYKGAVKVTNRIVLHSTGMDTLDRAFDAAGNQVWGSKGEPYQFRWVKPNASR